MAYAAATLKTLRLLNSPKYETIRLPRERESSTTDSAETSALNNEIRLISGRNQRAIEEF